MGGIWSRLSRFLTILRLVLAQTVQRNIVTVKQSRLFSPTTQPDRVSNILAQRPDLCPSRIFVPRLIDGPARPLPLVVMVHGGGFMMNRPCVDDPLARHLADTCGCLVASVDHRKAPADRFPAGYEDVVASILALIAEKGPVQVDRSKIILFGNSSGGNLVLGAAQDVRLRGMLLGVVAIAPVVNLVLSEAEQMATRPDPSVPEFLEGMWDTVLSVYVGSADKKTLQDPRLSPIFFEHRDHLPKHLFVVGCEHDMLCHEAEVMAKKVAGEPREELPDGWRAGGVRWKFVKGQPHAFDRFPKTNPAEEAVRVLARDELYAALVQWLTAVFDNA